MSTIQLLKLAYDLAALPIHTSECALGNTESFRGRLDTIKGLLTALNLQEYHVSFGIFEKLLKEPNASTFIQNNFDLFYQTIAGINGLILMELQDITQQKIFQLGVSIAQIQTFTVGEGYTKEVEEVYLHAQSIVNELLQEQVFSEELKPKLKDFSTVDYIYFQNEEEVLDFKKLVIEALG